MALHFTNLNYSDLKKNIKFPNTDTKYITEKDLKDVARQIREYCKKKNVRVENETASHTQGRSNVRTSRSSENINVTINERPSLVDYLLLSSIFSSRQQPIIINNAPGTTASSTRSTKQEKSEDQTNKFLFIIAFCVVTHFMVCAVYHLHFKKNAEKPNSPINYLANCQFGIAMFQLAFGTASFIIAGMSLSQSAIFFPFFINTFICLGSFYLFYREYNNTMDNEVEPYIREAKLLIDKHIEEKERGSPPPYNEPEPSAPSGYFESSDYNTDFPPMGKAC